MASNVIVEDAIYNEVPVLLVNIVFPPKVISNSWMNMAPLVSVILLVWELFEISEFVNFILNKSNCLL